MVAQFSQNDDPNTGNFVYLVSESGSRVSCPVRKDGSTEDQVILLYTRVSYSIYLVSGRKFQIFIYGSSQLISSMEKQICFACSFK